MEVLRKVIMCKPIMGVLYASRTKQNIWLNTGIFNGIHLLITTISVFYFNWPNQTDEVNTICTLSREYDVIFLLELKLANVKMPQMHSILWWFVTSHSFLLDHLSKLCKISWKLKLRSCYKEAVHSLLVLALVRLVVLPKISILLWLLFLSKTISFIMVK